MFNFSFLKCYQKKVIFCVSVFVVATNFSLSQASASTANNSDNTYKNKIYAHLGYMNIDSYMDIMLYGIGLESKLSSSTEIFCNYATGNVKLKKDCTLQNLPFKKQKSTDRSHIGLLRLKHYYSNFIFQADFSYIDQETTFKVDGALQLYSNNNTYVDATINNSSHTTLFIIKLSKKSKLDDSLYLLPGCSVKFNNTRSKEIFKGLNNRTNKIEKVSLSDEIATSGVIITPELVIGGDLFLTNIKINPEISFIHVVNENASFLNLN